MVDRSSKTMLGVNPRELHSWRTAECGGACERVYKADEVDAEIQRLREALERIDAHLEVRPDSELGQLQVISHNHSFGFWLALKAAREVLRNERKPFETLAPPAHCHSRDCDCHDCHYSKKHPQVKPHHARCGCFECAPRGPVETNAIPAAVMILQQGMYWSVNASFVREKDARALYDAMLPSNLGSELNGNEGVK